MVISLILIANIIGMIATFLFLKAEYTQLKKIIKTHNTWDLSRHHYLQKVTAMILMMFVYVVSGLYLLLITNTIQLCLASYATYLIRKYRRNEYE